MPIDKFASPPNPMTTTVSLLTLGSDDMRLNPTPLIAFLTP